ncbi:MAG: RluA family pseudouridine synthase [Bacteroidetes bacterium]|nr:RluA family pseudouridine synthase [Bacteroidota bacterium]
MDIASIILYEDNHLIAINKPAGVLVQGDETGDIPLSELVKDFIKNRDHKPGNVFCGVIHRIDRPVSGVVMMAKTSKALSKMNELFREDKIRKTYLALVNGVPEEAEKTLKNVLRKNAKTKKSDVFNRPIENGKDSELSYTVIENRGHQCLLEVRPVTGRFHQIRAQLAYNKTPIVGDLKYGAPQALKNKSICLHAFKIAFEHPIKKENIVITAKAFGF